MTDFNPHDWLPENRKNKKARNGKTMSTPPPVSQNAAAVETALQALEATGIDVTATYLNWLEIGFAFASEFGESGRDYFHRVSRFHPEYNQKECDEKYSSFLKSKGSGIGIGTFFHHLKQAGVLIHVERPDAPEPRAAQRPSGSAASGSSGHAGPASQSPAASRDASTFPGSTASGDASAFPGSTASGDASAFAGFTASGGASAFAGSAASGGTPPFSGWKPSEAIRPSEEDPEETSEAPSEEPMPVFPEVLYDSLPEFLRRIVAPATSPEERDLLLLGSLAAMSACFPTLYGIYHGKKVYPNLYLFVTAPASAGKGRLSLCKQLVMPIHYKRREQARMLKQQYTSEMAAYNLSDKDAEKPAKPPERMLFIPANNSSTGVFQLLADNEGRGLIFETEGDTLAQSFKTDYGNYSDGFRKAYHHETISYYRRTDREYVDIESPCLSTVLSGTPKQVTALIPSAENGLFSRFLFYFMNLKPEFQDVFANDNHEGMDAYFWQLGKEFLELYEAFQNHPPMRVVLTQIQKDYFLQTFSLIQERYLHLQPEEYIATVRRMGLNAFRIAMILVALRTMEDGDLSAERVCSDEDFENAMIMVKVLLKHSSTVFNRLPEEVKLARKVNMKERFLESLPAEFTTQDYYKLAAGINLAERTAEGYVRQFVKKGLLLKMIKGHYCNPARISDKGEGPEPAQPAIPAQPAED